MRESRVRFIRQQGITTPRVDDELYSALMLQPRIIGVLVLVGVAGQSASVFLGLAAALWWSALVPAHNPFDAIYNHAVAYRRGRPPLDAAPAPRRFAAGLAGVVALAIGVALLAGTPAVAWVFEALFVVAVAAVVFGDSCAGAALYHRLQRRLTATVNASRHRF
ncbi:MAG TPA: DUF4395 family protein [Vicinamibacterales bacterium]|nr:DUF4395 family protein [Vicinamibacterales bacterium]